MKCYYLFLLLWLPVFLFGQNFQHSLGVSGLIFNQRIQEFTYNPVNRPVYDIKAYPLEYNTYLTLTYKPRINLIKFKAGKPSLAFDLSVPTHLSAYGEINFGSSNSGSQRENYILLHVPAFLSLNYGASAYPNSESKAGVGIFAGLGYGYTYGKFGGNKLYDFWSPNMNAGLRFQFSRWGIELAYTGTLISTYKPEGIITPIESVRSVNSNGSPVIRAGGDKISQVQSFSISFYKNWTGQKKFPSPLPKFWKL